jgi:hypothetical protein
MICEVLYRIGNDGAWRDGDPVEVRAPGVFVTEAEFSAWLTGSEPSSIAALRAQSAQRMRDFAKRMRTLLDGSVDVAALAAASSIEEDEVQRAIADAHSIRARIAAAGGVDSTWGFEELRRMSVMIADLSLDEIEDMTSMMEQLPDGQLNPVLVRRRAQFVDYRTLLSAGSIDNILDPDVLVVPARGETPFDFDTLLADA